MEQTKVTLRQKGKYQWELLSPKGAVILDYLLFASVYDAECWVKKYISTWPTWSYEIKRLEYQ